MDSSQRGEKVFLEFSKEEAIVLFEWLTYSNKTMDPKFFQDQAEQRILWDMEACLEEVINETFDTDYSKIVSSARKEVRD